MRAKPLEDALRVWYHFAIRIWFRCKEDGL